MDKYPYKQKKQNGRHIDEHRLIMEMHLSRKLDRFEFVHHINGDKTDNRLANLEVITPKDHSVHHNQKHPVEKICAVCEKVFRPHPTKRARAKTCSPECGYALLSLKNRNPNGHRSKYRKTACPSEVGRRFCVPSSRN